MTEKTLPARAWNVRRDVLALLAAFWVVEMLLGLFLGAMILVEGHAMPLWMHGVALAAAGLLFLVGLRYAILCLRQRRLSDPVIAMDSHGLLDRRLCPTPIPWPEIVHMGVLHMRGPKVVFDLTAPGRARIRQPERTLARLNRLMLMPAYTLMPMGTTARPAELADAMRAWFNATRPAAGADQP
jgi:hypothetical protein